MDSSETTGSKITIVPPDKEQEEADRKFSHRAWNTHKITDATGRTTIESANPKTGSVTVSTGGKIPDRRDKDFS